MTDTKEMRVLIDEVTSLAMKNGLGSVNSDSLLNFIKDLQAAWTRKPAEQVAGTEPFGYCWYTEHMEYRFTHRKPPDCHKVIGELTPVYTHPAPEPVSVPVKWESRKLTGAYTLEELREHERLFMQREIADWRALAAERGG